jgi:hypothetical protein
MELIKIITDRFQKDWATLLIFILLGCLLACMKFELDKESYLSFLQTAAGVVAALIGFIGIFFVYKLQNIIDITKYYMGQINILKSELKIYKNNILIIQPQPDKINKQLDEIKRIIEQLDQTGHQSVVDIKLSDRTILVEIEYILKLILKNIDLETNIMGGEILIWRGEDIAKYQLTPIKLKNVSISENPTMNKKPTKKPTETKKAPSESR